MQGIVVPHYILGVFAFSHAIIFYIGQHCFSYTYLPAHAVLQLGGCVIILTRIVVWSGLVCNLVEKVMDLSGFREDVYAKCLRKIRTLLDEISFKIGFYVFLLFVLG